MAKEGCRYCREAESGVSCGLTKDIVSFDIRGILGSLFFVECYVHENCLGVSICSDGGDFQKGKSKRINYCPMCGRKLNFKED